MGTNKAKVVIDIGISEQNLELYEVPENDLSHYSKSTTDIMYKFRTELKNLSSIANRTDFDLGPIQKIRKIILYPQPSCLMRN